MLLVLSGSSAAGKTAVGPMLAARLRETIFHDSDEHESATHDRPATLDHWVGIALTYEARGTDLLLATQAPLGEVLACPEAIELTAIAGCVLDCNDFVRTDRLRARGASGEHLLGMDILCWAVFHRMHAMDPQWEQRVICSAERKREWRRWTHWTRADPRWDVPIFDTSTASIEQTADALAAWGERVRHDPPLTRSRRWWAGA